MPFFAGKPRLTGGWLPVLAGAAGVCSLLAGALAANGSFHFHDPSVIVPGVTISGITVGGMTQAAARDRVREWAAQQTAKTIALYSPESGRDWHYPLSDAGVWFDVDAAVNQATGVGQSEPWLSRLLWGSRERDVAIDTPIHVSPAGVDRMLDRLAHQINVKPQNAAATVTPAGAIAIVSPERKGILLDVPATNAELLRRGPDALREGTSSPIVVTEQMPKITSDLLRSLRYPGVVRDPDWPCTKAHRFSTYFGSSSDNRRHNIELAAAHIDGTLLMPGAVFSYNKVVGPREPSLGFRDAPTYQDGQVVPGPGGGVCQVSTTLYNAVLRTPGMTVLRRSHHSMPVHYVPAGCDATVAYGDIDFRFRNDTTSPVIVSARARGGVLSFGLYSAAAPTDKEIAVIPGDKRFLPSGDFTVETKRRIVDAKGVSHTETLSSDTYQPYHPPTHPAASHHA